MTLLPRRPIVQAYQMFTGRKFINRLDELNRTQWLRREELLALQRKKLHRLLTYAYEHVPYYKQLFDDCHFQPDDVLTDMKSFSQLPILTKSMVRDNFDALQTTEMNYRSRMSQLSTGGSTGHPMVFMQDGNFRDYVTADIHRHLGWADWKFGEIHCYIWGANFEVAASQALRSRLMDWTLNRFVTNAFILSDESMATFTDEVRLHHPRILFAYPSGAYRYAEFVRDRHINDIKFEAIFTSAEIIYPGQRKFIEETFGGRVFNRYGTRELGGISCECEAHTGMHASIDNNYIEILKDGRPAKPGEIGDVIVTNLNNFGMPFIRYSLADLAAWSTDDSCPCGRELPMMELTQARRVDMFKTKDGRAVWGEFSSKIFGIAGIKQFQIVQKSLDLVVARIVKDHALEKAKLDAIERMVKAALGDNVEVKFEFPEEIHVLESGKHRYAICEIDDQPAIQSSGGRR